MKKQSCNLQLLNNIEVQSQGNNSRSKFYYSVLFKKLKIWNVLFLQKKITMQHF